MLQPRRFTCTCRPGHEKHWRKHCAQYNACGRPVYFVRDDWYNNEYVPRYRHADDPVTTNATGDERHGDDDHTDTVEATIRVVTMTGTIGIGKWQPLW